MKTTRKRYRRCSGSLQARHAAAAMDLQTALRSERYHALQDTLKQAIERPMLLDAAREPCRNVLPPLAIAAWHKLKKGGAGLAAIRSR